MNIKNIKSIKKRLIDAGILTAIFIVAVIVFGYVTNRGNGSMTADMGAATLPQISFSCGEFGVNSIQGYMEKMDIPSMRDTITPVTNQRLNMNIKTYNNKISKIQYTVYSLNGKEKLLEKKIDNAADSVDIELVGENVLSEERVLEIAFNIEENRTVYFYTRIIDSVETNITECLNYIHSFHENAIAKAEGSGIGTAIEPNEKGDNSTFQHVTIHSDYDHVTWGELEPVTEGPVRISIKELNSVYTSVLYEYMVRCKGEENENDVYKVKEFFRVRHIADGQNTYLLDYDRTMDQIFDPTKKILTEKGIVLGIAPYDTQTLINGDGSSVSFVQADEVWNYNKKTDEMSLVFSFSDTENTDSRSQTAQHEIKLLSGDKKGNMTFAVYGYMNRGEHEGQVGVAIYYYDMEKSSVEEKAFISSNKSYGSAVYELGKLVYYSVERDLLYVMVEGTLYQINVKKGNRDLLIKDLKEQQYVVSDDGHMVAYQTNGKLNEATKVTIMNLESGSERTVSAGSGECVRPLGFIKNDFVYGLGKSEDTGRTVSGDVAVPMYKLEIQNSKSKVIKTYQQDGIFILDTELENNMITLKRVTKSGSSYTSVEEDYITNNEEKEESNIMLEQYVTELKESQQRLLYVDGISDKEPKVLKPKQVLFESPTKINFDKVDMSDKCYVYSYGSMQGIYAKAGAAIQKANETNGVVISSRQSYIWEKGNRNLRYALENKGEELNLIRSKLTDGQTPIEIMDAISEGKAIDLTGCAVEDMLYIINRNIPVIAMLDTSNAVILVGYEENYVTYIEAASGEQRSTSYEEMDAMTQASGHAYVGYAK